jgi:serine/threonine protein phosphatase PrpC
MKIKVFHTHKKSSLTYNYVQDKYQINPENKSIAIADGTTQSFRSEFWSDLLVTEFCKNPVFEPDLFLNFSKCLAEKIQLSSPKFSDNKAIASLERIKFGLGSSSTFLAVKFKNANTLEVISVGDCNLFIVKKNGNVSSFPFDSIDTLNSNKSFLNTKNLLKEEPENIDITKTELNFENGDKLFLCTDAISRLFLTDKNWIEEIVSSDTFDHFIEKIENLWNNNTLEEDDITILYLSDLIQNSNKIIPPEGFSFPEPPSLPPLNFLPDQFDDTGILIFSDMDIKTIMHNFSCIENDFSELKKKQKFHEILLISIVGLLSLILLILVLKFYPSEENDTETTSRTKMEKTSDVNHSAIEREPKTQK